MDSTAANGPMIHSYDVELRAIRCGAPGYPSATKHARGVTCPECRRLLSTAEIDAEHRH
jgi:hypothetical protein